MQSKEIDPTFVILNTNDWWALALTKDSFGRYILGDPSSLTTAENFRPRRGQHDQHPAGNILGRQRFTGRGRDSRAGKRCRLKYRPSIPIISCAILLQCGRKKGSRLSCKRPNSFVDRNVHHIAVGVQVGSLR